jgi:hypothetical protein
LGCELRRAVTIQLANTGCRPLTLAGATWNGIGSGGGGNGNVNDSALYRINSVVKGRVIAPRSADSLSLLFSPSDSGTTDVALTLFSDADNAPRRTIHLLARTDVVSFTGTQRMLQFATSQADTPLLDSSLVLANTGSKAITWPATPQAVGTSKAFVIERIEPPTAAPRATSRVTVRFLGGANGFTASETWRVATVECPDVAASIALTASVEKKPRIALATPSNVALPLPEASIALPTLLCESFKDTSIIIGSVGSDDLAQVQVQIDDNAGGAFSLLKQPKTTIPRGAQDTLTLRFRPRTTGAFTGRVRVSSNDTLQPALTLTVQARKDSASLRILQPSVELPSVAENTSSATSLAVQNTGTVPLVWPVPISFSTTSSNGVFVIDQATPNPTLAGGTAHVRVRFLGSMASGAGTPIALNASITDSCGRQYPFTASVRVVAGAVAMPQRIEIAPREEQEFPIKAVLRGGIEAGLPLTMRLRVDNATLVEAISPALEGVAVQGRQGNERELRFTGTVPMSIQQDSVLVRLRVRGLLGNDTTTTVRAESVQVAGVDLERPVGNTTGGSTGNPPTGNSTTGNATTQVRIVGLNYVGGLRLFYPRAGTLLVVRVVKATPNPASDLITLTIEASEATEVELRAVDVLGRRVALGKRSVHAGLQTVELSTVDMPTGWNVLEALAPSSFHTLPLIIVR